MKKIIVTSLMFIFLFIGCAKDNSFLAFAAEKPKAKVETKAPETKTSEAKADNKMEVAKEELNSVAKAHVAKAQKNIRPSMDSKEIIADGSNFICRYIVVDSESVDVNVAPSAEPKITYIGKIMYLEHIYEASGSSQKEAMAGNFEHVKTRRVTELARYHQGKWQN